MLDGGEWIEADELATGDRLKRADGSTVVIDELRSRSQVTGAYNLSVDDAHLDYVGETSVLVHNQGDDPVY